MPEAAPIVDGWRERTCYAKPSSGVPPHVTILVPFVPALELDDSIVENLRTLFGAFEGFGFELRDARRFPETLYLAPYPAEPFVRLTEAVVSAYPDFPPYEGAFGSVVPHVTTAEGDAEVLESAEADVLPSLPITAMAREVVLIHELEPDGRWHTRARLPLASAATS